MEYQALCKDCKYSRGMVLTCHHPAVLAKNRTGNEENFASIERSKYGGCGPSGKNFEPGWWHRLWRWLVAGETWVGWQRNDG